LKLSERRAIRRSWDDGKFTLRDLNREIARIAIHRHLLLCMALLAGENGQVPELVVVQDNTREIMKVFPSGKLPADPLQPNTVYETEPGSSRSVRYLSLYQWSDGGPKFAVFAKEVEP